MNRKVVLLAFILWLLSAVMSLFAVGLLELQIAYASPYTNIDVYTAYDMITNGSYPDLVVLDVRTKGEYDSGHIYGAVWIPVTELDARIGELAGHEKHEIIVYCLSGGRSATASGKLDSHSFTKVYNMLGGITAWQSAGYPVWIATVHNINTTFNYDTIQAAIDAPQTLDRHTVLVDAGIYYEHIVVNKSISLIGENRNNTIIDGNNIGTVIIITADTITISGFAIRNYEYYPESGIRLESNYNIVNDNIITDDLGYFGVYLDGANHNYIYGNTIVGMLYAVWGNFSDNNVLERNNVSLSSYSGIQFEYSKNNTIIDNYSKYSIAGVCLRNCSGNNIVSGNTMLWSVLHGLMLEDTNHTTIVHNNFVNNTNDVYLNRSFDNTWDNGCEGNYWSNYNGTDLDGDGIGDEYLPWEEVDYYPLMSPYIDGDVNHDTIVDIVDLSIVSIALWSTPIDPKWNPHADLNGDDLIDIVDLTIVAIHLWETW